MIFGNIYIIFGADLYTAIQAIYCKQVYFTPYIKSSFNFIALLAMSIDCKCIHLNVLYACVILIAVKLYQRIHINLQIMEYFVGLYEDKQTKTTRKSLIQIMITSNQLLLSSQQIYHHV